MAELRASWLSIGSLVMSAAALVVSLSNRSTTDASRATGSSALGPNGSKAAVSPGVSPADLERIIQRLNALEQGQPRTNAASGRGGSDNTNNPSSAPDPGSPAASVRPQVDRTKPRFTRFETDIPGIEIKDVGAGSLSVTNSDATLTGKMVVINAVDGDGNQVPMTIVLPPP